MILLINYYNVYSNYLNAYVVIQIKYESFLCFNL